MYYYVVRMHNWSRLWQMMPADSTQIVRRFSSCVQHSRQIVSNSAAQGQSTLSSIIFHSVRLQQISPSPPRLVLDLPLIFSSSSTTFSFLQPHLFSLLTWSSFHPGKKTNQSQHSCRLEGLAAYLELWARLSILGRLCWLAADQRTASFAPPNQRPPPVQSLPLSFSVRSPLFPPPSSSPPAATQAYFTTVQRPSASA
jgi:hypothetical protein